MQKTAIKRAIFFFSIISIAINLSATSNFITIKNGIIDRSNATDNSFSQALGQVSLINEKLIYNKDRFNRFGQNYYNQQTFLGDIKQFVNRIKILKDNIQTTAIPFITDKNTNSPLKPSQLLIQATNTIDTFIKPLFDTFFKPPYILLLDYITSSQERTPKTIQNQKNLITILTNTIQKLKHEKEILIKERFVVPGRKEAKNIALLLYDVTIKLYQQHIAIVNYIPREEMLLKPYLEKEAKFILPGEQLLEKEVEFR